jgi:hypothetical protein
MTIQNVHDAVLYFLNKEQNAYISHEEIDLVLDRAQMAQFNDYYSPKNNGQAPVMGYGETQKINDALSPFKNTYTFSATSSDPNYTPGGVVSLPTVYMYLISLYTTVYVSQLGRNIVNPVTVLNEEELVLRLNSQVIPVTTDDPICIMNANKKIQLFPDAPQSGKVFYFRRPAVPKFGYTQSGRTITYNSGAYNPSTNPTGSTQLEWAEQDVNNIIIKALSYYGLNISNPDTVNFAELKNTQGQ